MLLSRTLNKKKVSSNNIENPFLLALIISRVPLLSPTDFYRMYLKNIASRSSGVIDLV